MSRNGGGKEDGGDLGGGAWRRGLRPLEVRATRRRERRIIQAPKGRFSDWKRGLIPAPSHSHPDPKPSSSRPAPDLPRPLRRAPGTPRSSKWEAVRAAPSPRWSRGLSEDSAVPPSPRGRFGLGGPAPPPLRASRASRPSPGAQRSPPSRRRRRSAAGRPARVVENRGPPAARSARSEAIARLAGEEGRWR